MSKLIELDAAIAETWKDTEYTDPLNVMTALRDRLEALPTVDAVPVRHGKWTPVTNGRGGFECDRCHNYAPSYQDGVEHLSDWCPNCGARMEGESDE